ncbi:calcium-binding protein [Donghicola sp. XS_ASV15]|uniref:calcium-binding protein n=1 Tax=Donghicola sp. XS_ASV15 TaxID=3241295 RepID=UPI0035153D63
MGDFLVHVGSAFDWAEDSDFTELEGLRDVAVVVNDAQPTVYTLTGPNPGGVLAAWDLTAETADVSQIALSGTGSLGVDPELILKGRELLVSGLGSQVASNTLTGVSGIKVLEAELSSLQAISSGGLYVVLSGAESMGIYRWTGSAMDSVGELFSPEDMAPTDLTTFGGFVVAGGVGDTVLSVFKAQAGGGFNTLYTLSAEENPGISGLVQLASATVGGVRYVIATGAQSSSLSVFRLENNGALTVVDHVNDTTTSRLASAQVLDVVSVGDQSMIIVGGRDAGLSFFRLLPDGSLLHEGELSDTLETALTDVTAIAAYRTTDGTIGVAAGSAAEQGISLYQSAGSLDRTTVTAVNGKAVGDENAAVLMGSQFNDKLTAGSAGDIVRDGAGVDTMVGGAGVDIFSVVTDGQEDKILEFDMRNDLLDLSGWAFYRSVDQLEISVTDTGALITFEMINGTETLVIESTHGRKIPVSRIEAALINGPTRTLQKWVDPIVEHYADSQPTETHDKLTGDSWGEIIDGLAGDDWLDGQGGHDKISGGLGQDTLIGGDGDDVLDGGEGDDDLRGGAGDDSLTGGEGADRLDGGTGADMLDGGAMADRILGGDAGDSILGGSGNDTIVAGSGADHVTGDQGDDLLLGGAGNDSLDGGAGKDKIKGNAGDDALWGRGARDQLFGGGGADTLDGGAGKDKLVGQGGADVVIGGGGRDRLKGGGGTDVLQGDALGDRLEGGNGNDTLMGGAGKDQLFGGRGDDVLIGGSGNDRLTGGAGADTFVFSGGKDRVLDFSGNDILALDHTLYQPLDEIDASRVKAGVLLDFGGAGELLIVGSKDVQAILDEIIWL